MTDDSGVDRTRWSLSVLYVSNRARRDQNQHEHDQQRQYRPCELYLVTPVDLWRLARFISGAMSEADDGVNEQAGNYDEDGATDCEHQKRKLLDLLSWLRQKAE